MFTQTFGIEISLKVGLSKIDKEMRCGQASSVTCAIAGLESERQSLWY